MTTMTWCGSVTSSENHRMSWLHNGASACLRKVFIGFACMYVLYYIIYVILWTRPTMWPFGTRPKTTINTTRETCNSFSPILSLVGRDGTGRDTRIGRSLWRLPSYFYFRSWHSENCPSASLPKNRKHCMPHRFHSAMIVLRSNATKHAVHSSEDNPMDGLVDRIRYPPPPTSPTPLSLSHTLLHPYIFFP